MPLVKCPDCGTEVSSIAASCPKCGRVANFSSERLKAVRVLSGAVLALGSIATVIVFYDATKERLLIPVACVPLAALVVLLLSFVKE